MGIFGLLIMAVVSVALSELLRPKPPREKLRPASLGDFDFPTAIEGRPVPIVFGRVKLSGPNVIWYGDFTQRAIKETQRMGLFSKRRVVTGFEYDVGIQFGLCRGQVGALKRIWVGEQVIFDGTLGHAASTVVDKLGLFGGREFGNGGMSGTFSFMDGREDQAVHTYLSGFQNPIPAYRGTCFGVWEGGYVGNSTSIPPWAFELERFPNGLALTGGKHVVNGADANIAAIVYELLTDTDWGMGKPASKVDLVNLRAAGDTLHSEGNGYSGVIDSPRDVGDLLQELERQADGFVYLDQETGLWRFKLARADYDPNTIPEVTVDTGVEVTSFSRVSWEGTSNQVRLKYSDRARDYFETFAPASDLANLRMQGGEVVIANLNFPGIKDKTLASKIASRELRSLSYPLAKADVVVDRTFWNTKPGDVLAYTDADKSLTKLPMRVTRIDFGEVRDGRIKLALIQDVFTNEASYFGDPADTFWTRPTQDVVAFPANQQVIMEAPNGIARRDPLTPGVIDRLFTSARSQNGNEISFKIFQRNDPTTPSSQSYADSGEVLGLMLIGELRTALTEGGVQPSAVEVNGTPDGVVALVAAFSQNIGDADLGQNLINLILIDSEFMAARGATNQTTHALLSSTYRGMLDTAPTAHAINAKVYLVFVAAGLSDVAILPGNLVDVQLRAKSRTDEATQGEATVASLTMSNRARKPYPPVELTVNGTRFPASANFDTLKSGGTTLDDRGFEAGFRRRDYRTFDEVRGILNDASVLDGTFPANNTTQYAVEIIKDPGGSPVSLFVTPWAATSPHFLSRTKILRYNAGVKPSTVRLKVATRHTFEGVVREATQKLEWTLSLAASTLDNDTNMGVLNENVIGAPYTAPTTGTYTFNLGQALATGIVEARINAGAFVTVIAATATTGTLVGVIAADTIEVRHTQTGADALETFLEVDSPGGSSVDAYAIITF